ncbi:MAG: tRNA dihydrouridine(20/20a) synthase DusA [Gammaproteobacteria bacterium]
MQYQLDRKLAIAPMMDRTDRHYRYFMRLISRRVLLYTEMLTPGAILHGDRERLLGHSDREHPLALQLGGSDPAQLAACARIAADRGYDEVNLNIGCPSDRVQSARFGACLMAEPALVAECVARMRSAVSIPVTVKTRTGIDQRDSYGELVEFVRTVSAAGCDTFIIHARKAWLNGLSPKENRDVPPLQYETVYRLKQAFPELQIIINGGFTSMEQIMAQYDRVDGVMIARVAYHDPYLLAGADTLIFQEPSAPPTRREILSGFIAYARRNLEPGVTPRHMARHIIGLYQGQAGARAFRRLISEIVCRSPTGVDILEKAVTGLPVL